MRISLYLVAIEAVIYVLRVALAATVAAEACARAIVDAARAEQARRAAR